MSTAHKEPNYMMVFYALTVLTAIEIGVVFIPISKLIVGIALILMALVKAALVALYFMHLRYEKFALGIIAFTPLILCALLIFSLLPDLTGAVKTREAAKARAVEQAAEANDSGESAPE